MFHHLCIVKAIFQVATSLSIFSTTIPSLVQYRKKMKSNYIFTYANWNMNVLFSFCNHTQSSIESITYLMCSLFRQFIQFIYFILKQEFLHIFLKFFIFSYFSQHLPQISNKISDSSKYGMVCNRSSFTKQIPSQMFIQLFPALF